MISHTQKRKGVTLLIAVLISSAALLVGVGVYTLLVGEIRISGSEKDSLSAFYASDSGAECFLYWFFKRADNGFRDNVPFATSTDDGVGPPDSNTIYCNGQTIEVGGTQAWANGGYVDGYDDVRDVSGNYLSFSPNSCTRFDVKTSDYFDPVSRLNTHIAELRTFGESGVCGSVSIETSQRASTNALFGF